MKSAVQITFGAVIGVSDLDWQSAVRAPLYWHLNDYLECLLALAIRLVSDKAILDSGKQTIGSIESLPRQGLHRIQFSDGSSIDAKQSIQAGRPPHMSGPGVDGADAAQVILRQRTRAGSLITGHTLFGLTDLWMVTRVSVSDSVKALARS